MQHVLPSGPCVSTTCGEFLDYDVARFSTSSFHPVCTSQRSSMLMRSRSSGTCGAHVGAGLLQNAEGHTLLGNHKVKQYGLQLGKHCSSPWWWRPCDGIYLRAGIELAEQWRKKRRWPGGGAGVGTKNIPGVGQHTCKVPRGDQCDRSPDA